jgi:4-amino-4-deoxy-L-arabinose transferase-like glycosyltransferase
MEVERAGALSYDLTVPDRDPSAQRGVILGLLTVVAAWIACVVGGWFALGFVKDPRIVSRGFPLAVVALSVAATAWGARRSMSRARRNALLTILTISAVTSLLAYNTLANVKPTLPQVRYRLDSLDLPPGFRVVSEESHGDRFCRRGCPTVERVYLAPADDPDPVRTLILAMFDQGWKQNSDVEPENATTAVYGTIFAHLGDTAPHTVELTATRQS